MNVQEAKEKLEKKGYVLDGNYFTIQYGDGTFHIKHTVALDMVMKCFDDFETIDYMIYERCFYEIKKKRTEQRVDENMSLISGWRTKMISEDRFNKWAKKYDKSILQKILFKETHDKIIENLPLDEVANILDVACGTGKLLRRLANIKERQFYLYGVDNSKEMIKQARKRSRKISFQVSEATELPYYSGSFDMVICSHAFHHFSGFQCKFLQEAKEMLRIGGRIYIADGSIDSRWGNILFGKIINKLEGFVNHVSAKTMKVLLEENGFKVVKQIHFNKLAPTLLTIAEKIS